MRLGLPTAAMITGLAFIAMALAPQAAHAQHQPLIKPGVCAQGHVPVCAVKRKTLVTYMSVCAAQGVNARVIATDRGCFDGCPRHYVPVCAVDSSGQRRLYGNACEAEKSGATDIRKGRCRTLFRRSTSPSAAIGAAP